MTVANVYGLYIPEVLDIVSLAPAFSPMVLDAAGEKVAVVMQAPKTGSIRKIHFRTGTVTSATDTDVRIETVDATTGNPTGTLFGTTTNVTVASASITANAWITTGALTADCAVTRGSDKIAIVIAPTGTPNYQVSYLTGNTNRNSPYNVHYTASWSKTTFSLPVIALEYSDGTLAIAPGVYPWSAINTHSYGNGSTPDEVALKFSLAAPVRVTGVWAIADLDGDADFVLYDSDGSTVLASTSTDKDIRSGTSTKSGEWLFAASQQLSANTSYRLSLKPTSATTLTTYSFDVASAAILDQLAGGRNFHHSTRVDAGSWTDTTTRRPFMGLIIDGIDDGAGGAGGSVAWIS